MSCVAALCEPCRLWQLKVSRLVLRSSMYAKKISSAPLPHDHQFKLHIYIMQDGVMLSCGLLIILSLRIRQHFSRLLLSNFGQPVQIVVVFGCCIASAWRVSGVFCAQISSLAYDGWNKWLFELLSLLLDLKHQQGIFGQRTDTYWIFSLFQANTL